MPETKPVALITGASSGIGAAYARRLAREGYDLVLVARRTDRLNDMAQALGGRVEVLGADLGKPQDVERVAARIAEGVEVLVNNAGLGVWGPFVELSPEALDHMLQVNAGSLLRLTHAAAKAMAARGSGTIINISSGTVFAPMAETGIYSATKAFILAATRALNTELAPKGVRLQAVVPGLVETEFFDQAGSNRLATIPRERVMQADDLVEASMAALKAGELVCFPALENYGAFERYQAAEQEVIAGVSRDRIASRYQG